MPNLTGLNLNVDPNQARLEKTPSWTERLQNKLSVLTPQSVTEPGFVDALTQPTDAPRDMSNFSAYMGSGIRRGFLDPLKRYAMAVDKGMKGQPLSPGDLMAITEVHMGASMGGFLKKGLDPNKVRSFPAWHGGGKAFKKFEDKAIGTGEGFQAFGKGHYLTDSKGIANSYAKKIGNKVIDTNMYYEGEKLFRGYNPKTPKDWALSRLSSYMTATTPSADIEKTISRFRNKLVEDVMADEAGDFTHFSLNKNLDFDYHDVIAAVDDLDVTAFKYPEVTKANQNLYKTTIMKGKEPDEYDFIDWHKPLNQQGDNKLNLSKDELSELRKNQWFKAFEEDVVKIIPGGLKNATSSDLKEYVKAVATPHEATVFNRLHEGILDKPSPIMEKIKQTDTWKGMKEAVEDYLGVEVGEHNAFADELADELAFLDGDATIAQFIERAEQMFVPEEELIKELAAVGLPGIKYDAGTIAGGAKPGTKNYVVFNPDDITIEKHYINGVLQKPTD